MKSFRNQLKECMDNENRIIVDVSRFIGKFPQLIGVCVKNKSLCCSDVCREERRHAGD